MLKSLDIDLIQSEKKTLIGFFLLYAFLSAIILTFIAFLYFKFQKELMLSQKRILLQEYSSDLISRLKDLHINFDKYKFYPRDNRFNSAIYDSDGVEIFSTLKASGVNLDEVTYTSKQYIHFIEEPDVYYLGAKYVILEIEDNQVWLDTVRKNIVVFGLLGAIIMLSLGLFLLRLFLKPMKDALHLLDRFIKDTTHELNTPISAIVANIELIDIDALEDEKLKRKIKRIDLGAKTVSNIYQDLTYLALNHKIISHNERFNLSNLLQQRIEYFKTLSDVKKLSIDAQIEPDVFFTADTKKISKLIDNILSNAIKYNKIGGHIKVILTSNTLVIKDSGRGIAKDKIALMFTRYSRFDKSVGGFGIGLNIVSMIANEYAIAIDIDSTPNQGTTVSLTW